MNLSEQFRPIFYERTRQIIDGKEVIVMKKMNTEAQLHMR